MNRYTLLGAIGAMMFFIALFSWAFKTQQPEKTMNTTPAEIIKATVPTLQEIDPMPSHADFEFNVLPDGRLAGFNDIETVKVTVRVPIAPEPTDPLPKKK